MTETDKNEQIGFHKGALSTLAKEREELGRILGIVEQLMQMHVKALKELGVDLQQMAEQSSAERPAEQSGAGKPSGDDKPIEDML